MKREGEGRNLQTPRYHGGATLHGARGSFIPARQSLALPSRRAKRPKLAREFFDLFHPDQLAGAVPSVGAAERAAPGADLRAGRFHEKTAQVDQFARAQRFALRLDRRGRGNKMQIRGVRNDLVRIDRRLVLPFVSKEAHALADRQVIEQRLVRHPSLGSDQCVDHSSAGRSA